MNLSTNGVKYLNEIESNMPREEAEDTIDKLHVDGRMEYLGRLL